MRQNYFSILLLVCITFSYALQAQSKKQTIGDIKELPTLKIKSYKAGPPPLSTPTISPLSQSICSETEITSITATEPSIDGPSALEVTNGATTTYFDNVQNGVYFDLSNPGPFAIRISGLSISAFAASNTVADTEVNFHFYRTTTATTAVGNYSDPNAWSNFANGTKAFPPTLADHGYLFNVDFTGFGFTIPAGTSTGIYILCEAPASAFRLGFRTPETSSGSVSDGNITLTHLVRATDLFTTDNQPAGFYGKIFYHMGTIGSWERDNIENIIGNIASPDQGSGVPPFPISDILINTTFIPQEAIYTIRSYDVFGNGSVQFASVWVKPLPISSFTKIGNTLYADEMSGQYQWFDCSSGTHIPIDGETGISYTPTTNGSFGVTVTLDDCSVDSDCLEVVLANPGFEIEKWFVISPNPNNGSFKIDLAPGSEVTISNPLGQIVRKFKTENTLQIVEIPELSNGIYCLTAQTKDGALATQKMIVKK